MEPSNNSSSPDNNSRPRVDRGTGSEDRGVSRDTYSGRGNRRKGNQRNEDANKKSQFTGREVAMNGHVFDYTGERTPEKYIRTMKELLAHVGATYKDYTTDLKEGLENLALTDPVAPANPPDGNQVAFELWKMDIKEYREKLKVFANFRAGLYSLVLGQCTDALQERLKSHRDYEDANQDGIRLLVIIRSLIHTFEENRKLSDAIMDVKEKFYKFYQGRHMTLERYHELFLAQVEVLDEVGITIEDDALVMAVGEQNGREVPNENDRLEARNQELAIRFVRGTNHQHKGYLRHLRNLYLDGADNYPRSVHEAYNILRRREEDTPAQGFEGDGVSFAQSGERRDTSNVRCYSCQQMGHYANSPECPNYKSSANKNKESVNATGKTTPPGGEGVNALMFTFSQSGTRIPKEWILLDSQSTVDIFCNPSLVVNLRRVRDRMKIQCNAGTRVTNLVGDLPGYGPVWFDSRAIANVLSLKLVKDRYHVKYNSNGKEGFVVTKPNGEQFSFEESSSGLHYLDTSKQQNPGAGVQTTLVVNTMAENKKKYTNNDYLRAMRARELQMIVGRPSTAAFLELINTNMIANCPVTPADVEAAEHILGPDIGSLKGKTTRRNPPIVESPVTPVPTEILKRYQKVTLCVDIMYVNRIAMVVSISRNIKFGTIEAIPNNKSGVILKSIQAIIQIYRRNGLVVEVALMDGEFAHLRGDLASMGVTLNDTSRDEHVGDVERYIRTIKERMRAIYNTLPFQKVPARLIVEMGKASVFWLNSLPQKNGLGSELSPRTIVTGQKLDFKRHCRFQFGQYVQTHEEHNNSMSPRTVGALALRPTGNAQGSHYFMSLSTGRVLNRLRGTALPMPDDVIDRVHRMARQQKADPGLLFGDRNMTPIYDEPSDEEEDEDYLPASQSDEESQIDDEEDGEYRDDLDGEGPTGGNEDEPLNDNSGPMSYDVTPELVNVEGPGVGGSGNPGVDDAGSIGVDHAEDEVLHQDGEDGQDPESFNDSKTSTEDDEQETATTDESDAKPSGESRYNLREKRTRSYSHLYDPETFRTEDSPNNELGEVVLVTDGDTPADTPQMSMKRGLKEFGEEGYTAVRKEMQQLHDRKVMQPIKRKDLTPAQKREALGYLMFLKKKRNGTVKGRGCADGRKQRAYITKEESTSPTISTEAVFLTAVVDAWEGRKVAVLDVPGAFMQVDMDETVHMRFEGEMVDKLLEIDEHLYASYVTEEKGKKVMYVELLKALYGTLRAARLFWGKLQAKLVNDWDSPQIDMTVAW